MKLPDYIENKMVSREEAHQQFSGPFRTDKKIVFTNGCFDILHRGHIHLLSAAKNLGDLLVIGLNTDSSVRKLKGPGRPVQDELTRAEIIASLSFVDFVILFDEETPGELIRQLKPDVLVKGGDYSLNEIVGNEFVTSYGGTVCTIPLLEGFSSSALINKIEKR